MSHDIPMTIQPGLTFASRPSEGSVPSEKRIKARIIGYYALFIKETNSSTGPVPCVSKAIDFSVLLGFPQKFSIDIQRFASTILRAAASWSTAARYLALPPFFGSSFRSSPPQGALRNPKRRFLHTFFRQCSTTFGKFSGV